MPQTSEPRAGISLGPAQGRVVLMAGVFLNHFYKNQPVAQLQQGRAQGPAQPLRGLRPWRPPWSPGKSTVSRGYLAPPPAVSSFPGIRGGADTVTQRPPSETAI